MWNGAMLLTGMVTMTNIRLTMMLFMLDLSLEIRKILLVFKNHSYPLVWEHKRKHHLYKIFPTSSKANNVDTLQLERKGPVRKRAKWKTNTGGWGRNYLESCLAFMKLRVCVSILNKVGVVMHIIPGLRRRRQENRSTRPFSASEWTGNSASKRLTTSKGLSQSQSVRLFIMVLRTKPKISYVLDKRVRHW